ncbi:MAG: hypothetical protein LBN11_02470 [Tannerella sp.]|jgi:hypothetical protein|nr:hypothetical protein [Tannerella sp.]
MKVIKTLKITGIRGMNWARPGESVGFIESQSMHTFATGTIKSVRKIDNQLFDLK